MLCDWTCSLIHSPSPHKSTCDMWSVGCMVRQSAQGQVERRREEESEKKEEKRGEGRGEETKERGERRAEVKSEQRPEKQKTKEERGKRNGHFASHIHIHIHKHTQAHTSTHKHTTQKQKHLQWAPLYLCPGFCKGAPGVELTESVLVMLCPRQSHVNVRIQGSGCRVCSVL